MIDEHLRETYQFLFDGAHEALKHGPSFVPFGAGVRVTGERIHANTDLGWKDADPRDHIGVLLGWFRQEDAASGLIAAGLVFDTAPSADALDQRALCFHLEGANGRAVQVLLAYQRSPEAAIQFGAPSVTEVQPEVFRGSAPE